MKRCRGRGRRCSPPPCSRRRSRGCCCRSGSRRGSGTPGDARRRAAGRRRPRWSLADARPHERAAADADWRDGLRSGWRSARRCGRACRAAARRSPRARARGFGRADASRLSWEVGLPVLVGAVVRKRPRRGGARRRSAAAFASTLATARAVGLERRGPLWPWAAWRAALAAAVLVVRQNRARDRRLRPGRRRHGRRRPGDRRARRRAADDRDRPAPRASCRCPATTPPCSRWRRTSASRSAPTASARS